jgi:hypothetical protein
MRGDWPTAPDRLYIYDAGLTRGVARKLAYQALREARKNVPKLSRETERNLYAIWGVGYFGVGWHSDYVWFQEAGIRPFTMTSLEGKIIPMWVDDPRGEVERQNRTGTSRPETRTTASGRKQTLIFRRAGRRGAQRRDGTMQSYPGSRGRIARREARRPYTRPGKRPGAIAKGNMGVRWRHPGLKPRWSVATALEGIAEQNMMDATVWGALPGVAINVSG